MHVKQFIKFICYIIYIEFLIKAPDPPSLVANITFTGTQSQLVIQVENSISSEEYIPVTAVFLQKFLANGTLETMFAMNFTTEIESPYRYLGATTLAELVLPVDPLDHLKNFSIRVEYLSNDKTKYISSQPIQLDFYILFKGIRIFTKTFKIKEFPMLCKQ